MYTVKQALNALLNVCDGAQSHDGSGFNGYDTHFAHSLGRQNYWSEKQENAAFKMLQKYRKQLASMGINHNDLVMEFQVAQKETKHNEASELFVANGDFSIQYSSAKAVYITIAGATKWLANSKIRVSNDGIYIPMWIAKQNMWA